MLFGRNQDVYHEPLVFHVKSLETEENVCDQILRPILRLDSASMAHVTMPPRDASLLHQHEKMHEIYYILSGSGKLYFGKNALVAMPSVYQMIEPGVPHKMLNAKKESLEHLVIAMPPFDPSDVHMVDDDGSEPKSRIYDKPRLQVGIDGGSVSQLFSSRDMNVSLATGHLNGRKASTPHMHRNAEEVYYFTSGYGRLKLGARTYEVGPGTVAYIPRNVTHNMENPNIKAVHLLCLSSPPYNDSDFYRV